MSASTNKIVAYRRVSTESQNTERQLYDTGITFDLEFEDKMSGKDNSNRKGFQACMKALTKGDTLYIHDISRAGRNTEQVLAFIRTLTEKGVNVKFYKEGLEFGGEGCDSIKAAISQMVLTVLAACHTLFLTNNSSAIKEGLKRVKDKGKKLGSANPKWNRKPRDEMNKRKNTKAREWAEKYRTQISLMVSLKMTLAAMAQKMRDLGLKTPTGKDYTACSVSNLCKYLEIQR
jgi:DNA invertase Pin-like site-specific DNA recombinase